MKSRLLSPTKERPLHGPNGVPMEKDAHFQSLPIHILQGRQYIKKRFICWVKCTWYFWTIHVLLHLIMPPPPPQCAAHETILTRKLFQRCVKSPVTTNTLFLVCLLNGCDWRFFVSVTEKPAGGGVAYKETFLLTCSHHMMPPLLIMFPHDDPVCIYMYTQLSLKFLWPVILLQSTIFSKCHLFLYL